ncbi:MAG: hypothetical protein IIY46_04770 [Lachnospiraceae bacterium]|nr:hypothetical protein [Lachnospiraceae bacterium]
MKRKGSRILAGVLIAALLLPLALKVGAEEIYGLLSGSSFSSYITFYNMKNEEAALYVSKSVESADAEHPAPEDDVFEFVLKLNGEIARDLHYTLMDEKGNHIYNYEDGQTTTEDKNKFEVELKTDRYGRFFLKAGQTAKFENLRPNDYYEVTESECDPYVQIDPPAGEAAKGTLTPEGADRVFRNLYPGTFTVRKTVPYPAHYELPETPAFKFLLKIDDEPCAGMAYHVMDAETGAKISEGTTAEDGTFTLHGNTYAVFPGIPADRDYYVEEILEDWTSEGWRVSGDTSYEGATGSDSAAVNFTNVIASFAVSKEIFGGEASEDPFTFQVLDEHGDPVSGALSYYLYDKRLQLVEGEQPLATAEDGTFLLKGGQKAVFIGIPKGTVYGVRETDSGRYVPYLPAGEGYLGKTVGDSPEVLPFVNAVVPSTTLLTVKKALIDNSEDHSAPKDREFSFRITQLVEGEYVPIPNAPYDIIDAEGTGTYTTDENGVFKLKAWQTARFLKLKKGETYRVEELNPEADTAGFTAVSSAEAVIMTKELTDAEGDPLTVSYPSGKTNPVTYYLVRVEDGGNVAVGGAAFTVTGGVGTQEKETASDGRFSLQQGETAEFTGLEEGKTYRIIEQSSPSVLGFCTASGSIPVAENGTLTIRIPTSGNESIAADADITLKLRRVVNGGFNFVAGQAYVVVHSDNTTSSGTTASDGSLVLRKGDTAYFSGLAEADYLISKSVSEDNVGFTLIGDQAKEGTLTEEALNMTFQNSYKEPDEPTVSIQKKNMKEEPLTGASMQLIKKDGSSETVITSWVSGQTPHEFTCAPGVYYIRETEAPEGYEVAEDIEIVIRQTTDVQYFAMTDKPDYEVPTGVEEMRRPIVRKLLFAVILLAALTAGYFGIFRKKKKA